MEVSKLVTFTVTCDSTTLFARGDSVISEMTEVVLVVVEVTAGRRDEHLLAAAVFEARQPKPRIGEAWQML